MHFLDDITDDQWDCIEFITAGEDTLVAADVGTGKTVISLTAAEELRQKQTVKRWLVFAPLLVATDTWANEPDQWDHLRHLSVAVACGSEAERIAALEAEAEFTIVNYENMDWLLNYYPRDARKRIDSLPFDGLILDEIDKLKSVSSNRFKAFRNRIGHFKHRIGLTGTLIPNDLTELWGQVYMVDGGQSFGRSFYKWRKKYFYPIDFNQYKWRPFPATKRELLNLIADLSHRVEAKGLPEVEVLPPHKMNLPEDVFAKYKKLERDFYLELNETDEVDAETSAVLSGKLQQITAGFSYVKEGKKNRAVWHTQAKFAWLDKLHRSLGRQQLLVFYHFTEELAELKRIYPRLHYLGGGVSNKQARKSIALWNAGELDMLALHPASAGHGLNLQKSGAHHIAFLTLPWSGGMYKQVVGRLARRGQSAPTVYIHTALYNDTIDEHVFDTMADKLDNMESFLNALKDRAA